MSSEGGGPRNSRWQCPADGCRCARQDLLALIRHMREKHSGQLTAAQLAQVEVVTCQDCGMFIKAHGVHVGTARCAASTRSRRAPPRSASRPVQAAPPEITSRHTGSAPVQAPAAASDDSTRPAPAAVSSAGSPPWMNVRVPEKVPKHAHVEWGELCTNLLLRVCAAATAGDQSEADRQMRRLLALPCQTLASLPRGGRGAVRQLRSRLREVAATPALLATEAAGTARPQPTDGTAGATAKRVARAIEAGHVSKAAKAVMASPVLAVDAGVRQQLLELHPQPAPRTQPVTASLPPAVQVDVQLVAEVGQGLKAGVAAGLSGWTYGHIKAAAAHPGWFPAVTKWVNLLLTGQLAPSRDLLASRGIALDKGGGKARPIAIGEALHRFADQVVARLLRQAGRELAPAQLGVGVAGGAEAATWAVRTALEAGKVVVQVDFSNAFNAISRAAVLAGVAKRAPGFARYALGLYRGPSEVRFRGEDGQPVVIPSSEGVRQGAPTSPALFAIALQDTLLEVASDIDAAIVAYLDDVYIIGSVDSACAVYQRLKAAAADMGLATAAHKCAVFSLLPGLANDVAEATGIPAAADGLTVLGTPVGEAQWELLQLRATADRAADWLSALMALQLAAHHKLVLLLRAGWSRTSYLARTSRPSASGLVLPQAHDELCASVAKLAGVPSLSGQAATQASWPIRAGGLGLIKLSDLHCRAAATASVALAQECLAEGPTWLQPAPHEKEPLPIIAEAVATLSSKNLLEAGPARSTQRVVTQAIAKSELEHAVTEATQLGQRARAAALRSASAPEAGAWLRVIPFAKHLLLSSEEVACGLRTRLCMLSPGLATGSLGTPTPTAEPPTTPCPCGQPADILGHHALGCTAASHTLTIRHHLITTTWRQIVSRCGCSTVMEPNLHDLLLTDTPTPNLPAGARGDILVLMNSSAMVGDVTVGHPGASSYLDNAATTSGATASRLETAKFSKYRDYTQAPSKAEFLPLAMETYGRWGEQAKKWLDRLCKVAEDRGLHGPTFKASAYSSISLALVKGNTIILRSANNRFFQGMPHYSNGRLQDLSDEMV